MRNKITWNSVSTAKYMSTTIDFQMNIHNDSTVIKLKHFKSRVVETQRGIENESFQRIYQSYLTSRYVEISRYIN